ncbi:NAD(P)-binding protein [Daldinia loculata]|uniref:NAD(P)-binding protein n=1 Tax=Daldinia loculata TaxID=103429 RepID=UPI0020C1E4FD|nr:NAD(P)-binding protein [Daldinia loculata]KAI1647503.1 NAD(P)-binding protein [Daldinia loculata]
MGTFPGFLYRQVTFKPKPLPKSLNLSGKTALVTGGNAGLGFEAAKELTSHGLSRIILGVRSVAKGEEAKKTLLTLNPQIDVQVWAIDQESFESIKNFADQAASLDRLDIAILNAGVKSMEYVKSKTGHELNVQVNHLGTALLSLLILGPLKRTAAATGSPSRLTIVSSENHFWVKLKEIKGPDTLATMDKPETFGKGMDRYNATKLLNVLWMRELSAKAAGSNVIIDAVNPGFCQSTLHRTDSSGSSFANLIGWTAAQGGHCLTDAATQHEEDGNGAYMSEQSVKSPSPFVLSPAGRSAQTKIWNETIQLLKDEAPGVDLLANLQS